MYWKRLQKERITKRKAFAEQSIRAKTILQHGDQERSNEGVLKDESKDTMGEKVPKSYAMLANKYWKQNYQKAINVKRWRQKEREKVF